jgi:outer membrane murein-binding lipoprotein Lpp
VPAISGWGGNRLFGCVWMEDREAYIRKMKDQLRKLGARIDSLAAKAKAATADAKAEYERQLPALREKQRIAQQRLDELERAGGAAWEELKYGLESAFTDLSSALDRAALKFGQEMK